MNFDLRKAVIANLDDSNYDEIRETIMDAIESGEEKTLPGLGVMFEILWNGSNDNEKEKLLEFLAAIDIGIKDITYKKKEKETLFLHFIREKMGNYIL